MSISSALLAATVLVASLVASQAMALSVDAFSPPQQVREPKEAIRPIQDNSFLIEEAYNQERGVVQHISWLAHDVRSAVWTYQFTQEWPLGGVRHQLSYSLGFVRGGAAPGAALADSKVNYRLQLVGNGDARLAIAPRLTLVLPSGDASKGRGAGAPGLEVFLPLSLALSDRFVGHANLGGIVVPDAHGAGPARATTRSWTSGGSLVWLAKPRLNLLLEAIFVSKEEVSGPGTVMRGSQTTLSPGVRWAYDFSNGLQVVPGVALPLSSSKPGELFLYVSFEHPFRRQAGAPILHGASRVPGPHVGLDNGEAHATVKRQ